MAEDDPEERAESVLGRMLALTIAYRVQEQRLGKLGREMRQRLDRLAKGGGEPVRHLKVGTVMVREHKGTLHEVTVVPGGFSWRDKTYPSLSAIALAITGTSWNGPRFFGLRGEKAAWRPRSWNLASRRIRRVPRRAAQIRTGVRPGTSPSTPAANGAVASRRECAAKAPTAMGVRSCIGDEGRPLGADRQG